MKTNKCLHSVALASATLILYLILVSSTASAATEQSASPVGPYAYISNSGSDTISVIDTATDTVKDTLYFSAAEFAVTPEGSKIYVTDGSSVSVIDIATKKVIATITGFNDVYGIAVTPDGKKVYVTDYDEVDDIDDPSEEQSCVYVIDTATNTVTACVAVGMYLHGVVVSPDGKKVYVTHEQDQGYVSVIDTANNTFSAEVHVGSFPTEVAVSPDGKKVYVINSQDNTVSVIDTATNNVTAIANISVFEFTVSPDGKYIYATNHASLGAVYVIDTATKKRIAKIPVGLYPTGIAITPDGKKVYVTNSGTYDDPENTVSIIDTTTNNVTNTVNVGYYPDGVAIGPAPKPILPVANFSANPTSGMAPLNVSFVDSSTGTPTAWEWNFGDRTNSTEQNPVHKYSRAGNYTVALTATNAAGNNTTKIKSYIKVTAPIKPVANFTSNITNGSAPLTVQFTDLSKYATSWSWSFGDRTNSTEENPVHKYSRKGNYTVALTVTNVAGNNTITKKSYIKVVMKPVANFTSNVTNGSAPLTVQFTDLSKYATSWSWSFGDRTNSTVQNPVHKYSRTGNYTVALTAINAVGNNTMTKKSYIKVTAVPPKPAANFTSNVTSGPAPLTVQFTDLSKYATSWFWNFGDKTNSTVQSPMHKYSREGNYTVVLTATNAAGNNTITKKSYIKVK